jgi:hypothetical protein
MPGELNPVRRRLTAEEKELLAKREAELVAAGVFTSMETRRMLATGLW